MKNGNFIKQHAKYLLCFCVYLSIFSVHAQRIVTGRVTDAETGEPVPMASVYLAGTTVGTNTDIDGNYRLAVPGQGSSEIVISHVAYEAVFQKFEIPRKLVRFDVALNTHTLEEIVVVAQKQYRKKDVKVFWDRLLDAQPSKKMEIINPEDIYFFYNAETDILKVTCRVPIQMINHETGYKIHYTLKSFIHDCKWNTTGWTGNALFEELEPTDKKQQDQWEKNRKEMYHLSLGHFLQALYHNRLKEEGFLLNYVQGIDPVLRGLVKTTGKQKLSPPINGNDFLFTDSVPDSKIFRPEHGINPLLLTCFGKQIHPDNIHRQTRYFNYPVFQKNVARNYLSCRNGAIRIFADGTYTGSLEVNPYINSPAISGLSRMLPIEYGLTPDSTNLLTDAPTGHLGHLTFISTLDSLMQRQYSEKIYLTTDRSYYAAGDTIWLSAWLLNGGTLEPTNKSRMLYIELIRPDSSVLRHQVLEVSQGLAFGQIVLPTSLPQDDIYRLRAYSRWSLNFNENTRFEKIIPIIQFKNDVWKGPKITENKNYEWKRNANGKFIWRRKKETVTSDKLQVTSRGQTIDTLVTRNLSPVTDLDLQFLPEGGRWAAGFPCRMAFKAITSDGCGINVEGEIVDDLGETVANFQSLHQGMGSVFLAPQPGRKYHARLFNGHTIDLPLPDSTGIVLNLKPARNDSLDLQLYFPPEIVHQNATFHLVAQSRGLYATTWEISALRTRVAMRLPIDQLKTGITRFTLFTKEGIPCNERQVFIDKEDEIRIHASAQRGYGKNSNIVKLQLQAKDAEDDPVQGVFTVSVTDSLYGGHDTREANLYSQVLLSSDLKGKIENPGWHFYKKDSLKTEALDLVMSTHGWSGYSWEDVRNAQKTKPAYTPERDYRISGRVTNLRGMGAKGVSVSFIAQGATILMGDTLTDTQGRFSFDRLLPQENTLATIIAKHQKGKKNALGLAIELDKQPIAPSPLIKTLPQCDNGDAWEERLTMYHQQKLSDEHWLDSLLKRTNSKLIKEVTIVGKRSVKGSFNLNGPGQADKVLYEEDIARYDKYDGLLDIFKAEFPQLKLESWKMDEMLRGYNGMLIPDYPIWRFENRTVMFVLNGRRLPFNLPAVDTLYLRSYQEINSLNVIATSFWNISATDITGIEVIDSPEYLFSYFGTSSDRGYDGPTRPLIVEITTRSGDTDLERVEVGTAKVRLHGFSVPKQFYVPKYYPDNIVDQAEYDVKPTLYWNPEVVTDKDGKAEINFPIGLQQRGLQIRVEGIDLNGRIGSVMKNINR